MSYPPVLGTYDYYAIKWGYTVFPEAKTTEEEVPYLESIIKSKMGTWNIDMGNNS